MQKPRIGPRAEMSRPSKPVNGTTTPGTSSSPAAGKRERVRAGLSERLAELSPKRQEIIRPVLENPREFVLLSVRDLAGKLQTDPATMVRIVQGLGFESYREFQRHLYQLSVAFATSLDMLTAGTAENGGKGALVRASLERDLANLRAMATSLDVDRVLALARRLFEARKILLLGGDAAVSLVYLLEYHLTMVGLPVFTATTPGRAVHLTRGSHRGEIAIGISFRRGLRQTVEGLQTAKANGAYTVGITDTFVSPIARSAHESFIVSVDTPSFGASYVAPTALIDTISAALVSLNRSRILSMIEEVDEEQRRGFRWYQV